ncbi:hypothetical protein CGLO_13209 [Colletotrichum gloeosporioides Cg-14]|uniref:Uncharacterized protein n=1 Tax=Colletotrichum gloeosporioides (strain Cg-14) TaxID=1237896 RepID=T0K6L7_COLGC|nr:hypothetical protein CGLO_13209 [Colletotrichum gloeosporioides Cg-14]
MISSASFGIINTACSIASGAP